MTFCGKLAMLLHSGASWSSRSLADEHAQRKQRGRRGLGVLKLCHLGHKLSRGPTEIHHDSSRFKGLSQHGSGAASNSPRWSLSHAHVDESTGQTSQIVQKLWSQPLIRMLTNPLRKLASVSFDLLSCTHSPHCCVEFTEMVNHVKMMPTWHSLDEVDAEKGLFSGFSLGSHFYGDEFKHP